jgi:hypothetical protein
VCSPCITIQERVTQHLLVGLGPPSVRTPTSSKRRPLRPAGNNFRLARPLQRKHGSARPSWHTSASLEGRMEPSGKAESHGVPTTTLISTNGTDMTTHSEQERGNHALTQHDPGHSTTTTSIPLQRWDNGNYTTYPHLYANSSAHTAHPRRHRST